MIILEGTDCVGKTTLAETLFKQIPKHADQRVPMMRHFTKLPPQFNRYWGYKQCINRDVILDRFHMSGIAYPIMYGDDHNLTPFKYSLIDANIALVGGVTVVICPDNQIIKDRCATMPAERVEMYTLDQVLKVNDIFRSFVDHGGCSTGLGTYHMNYDLVFDGTESPNAMADAVMDLWIDRQRMLDVIANERPRSVV